MEEQSHTIFKPIFLFLSLSFLAIYLLVSPDQTKVNSSSAAAAVAAPDNDVVAATRRNPGAETGLEETIITIPDFSVHGQPCQDRCEKRGYGYTWCTVNGQDQEDIFQEEDFCTITEGNKKISKPSS